ncbi:MAG: ATP-binding protein, partial [Lentisphaerae bacterium]|nr:ATP-binding protein [Lentisphaerota bacterium]
MALVKQKKDEAALLSRLEWEALAARTEFPEPGEITRAMTDKAATQANPGLGDILLAKVDRLGHRDKFPRPYDWENLIAQLEPGEELLWIVEKSVVPDSTGSLTDDALRLYLGVRFGLNEPRGKLDLDEVKHRRKRFEVLSNSFARRAFPESTLTLLAVGPSDTSAGASAPRPGAEGRGDSVVELLEGWSRQWGSQVSCVAGVPSPKDLEGDRLVAERDEEARPFASLNDVGDALDQEGAFAIVFSVTRAPSSEILERFRAKAVLRDHVRPHIKLEIGRNESQGKQTGTQKTITTSAGTSEQEARWLVPRLAQALCGSQPAGGAVQPGTPWWPPERLLQPGRTTNYRSGKEQKLQPKRLLQPGRTTTTQETKATGSTESTTDQRGSSVSISKMNTLLEFLDSSLDQSMKHLQMAMGTGGYFGCAMVYAEDRHVSRRIGRSLAAVLSGSKSHLRPLQILPFNGDGCMFQLNRNIATHDMLARVGVYLELLDCEQAGRLLLLPDSELSGLKMRRSVFYGRPGLAADLPKPRVEIGTLAVARPSVDSRRFPTTTPEDRSRGRFRMSLKDLYSHLLVVGTTGSGKTLRAARILNGIEPDDACRVIVIETAKKTYRDLLRRGGRAPRVFTLGDSRHSPFRINPFYFDPGTSLKQHISVLADAMCELLPVEALIGPKLREAIERCYIECQWDIETGEPIGGDFSQAVYPDMVRFNVAVHDVCRTLEDYGPEVRSNYKGALLNRARIFIDDLYQDIFAFDGNRPFNELFDRDTIIEMEEMPPSEINMPAFIVSLVLQRLRAFRFLTQSRAARPPGASAGAVPATDATASMGRAGVGGATVPSLTPDYPPVLLVIEEAHNVLHRKFESERSEREAGKGKRLVEQVSRLMMEGRALHIGVMVVDQSPKNLADAVVANANTKLVFRQEAGDETKAIGTALGLPETDWPDLQRLEDGECIVKCKAWPSPVKLASLNADEIPQEQGHPEAYTPTRPPRYGEVMRLLNGQAVAQKTLASAPGQSVPASLEMVRFLLGKRALEASSPSVDAARAALAIRDRRDLEEYFLPAAQDLDRLREGLREASGALDGGTDAELPDQRREALRAASAALRAACKGDSA